MAHPTSPRRSTASPLLRAIRSEPDVRIRAAMLRARRLGKSGTTFRGASVLADRMQHGGFVSSAAAGNSARAATMTKSERDAWLKGAFRRKLVRLSKGEQARLGLTVKPKKKPPTAATLATRRDRAGGPNSGNPMHRGRPLY